MNDQQARQDDGQAAHQMLLEQEQQESEVTGFECPFCATVYAVSRSDCDGTDLVCCGEIGECVPYYGEME